MRRRQVLCIGALAASAALFAGCSGGGDGGGGGESSQDAEGLAADAERFALAIVGRDGATAYQYMTPSCQEEMTSEEFTAELTVAIELAKAFGMDLTKAEITGIETRNVEDGTGEVKTIGEVDGEPLSEDESWDDWTYEDGRWRSTDCGMGTGSDDTTDELDLSDDGDAADTTVAGELRPAEEARAEKQLADARTVSIGESVDLGEGMSVTVTSMEVRDDDGDPVLDVAVRAENRGEDGYSPSLDIRCTGSTDAGSWVSDSTYEPNRDMPSGSFEEGTISLSSPSRCRTPAYVVIEQFFSFDATDAKVRIDDDVVARLG